MFNHERVILYGDFEKKNQCKNTNSHERVVTVSESDVLKTKKRIIIKRQYKIRIKIVIDYSYVEFGFIYCGNKNNKNFNVLCVMKYQKIV